MGDAWRALASERSVHLKVLIQERTRECSTRFNQTVTLRNLDCTVVYDDARLADSELDGQVRRFAPDVMFIVGWRAWLPRHFAVCRAFAGIPKVLIFDLPFEWSLKKILAPVVLHPYLRHFCGCFVPGARALRYARWLGFSGSPANPEQVPNPPRLGWTETGLFCANAKKFSGLFQQRQAMDDYPRQFLFVGRYVPEKGIAVLLAAYRQYRELVEKASHASGELQGRPWGLTCCGMGPLGKLLEGVEGVRDVGFVQPDALPDLFLRHGAFVLPSSHEPWGVVLAEAAAAGLPIVCTEACGASLDVVAENGIVCKTGDSDDIARALLDIHMMPDAIRGEMGGKGMALAAAYSCEAWAAHVADLSARMKRKGAVLP
jgi:glycosyltransferase involved in cell wall biosynthesis